MTTAARVEQLRPVWNALLRAEALALPRVHLVLRAAHGLSLSEFTVLRVVAEHEPASMTELQHQAIMSAAGITRVIAALDGAGLVERRRTADDRRLLFAHMTAKGLSCLNAAQSTVDAEVSALLDSRCSGDDLAAAARVLLTLGDAATLDR